MMKNVLLLVHDDGGQEARLQAALDVARAVDGHLTCLDVAVLPAMISADFDGTGTAMLIAEERNRESENKVRIQHRLVHDDVPWNWVDVTGELAPSLVQAAEAADLIVVNRRLDGFPVPDMRGLVRSVVVKSHRPVLAVPEDRPGIEIAGRALVAWDGSAAAWTALRMAVSLLALAEDVVLFEVQDGSVRNAAEEAAIYLSRHGVRAQIVRRSGGCATAEAVLGEARQGHFDYVVLGAFEHSALRDALFGGVARTMLTHSPLPLLICG